MTDTAVRITDDAIEPIEPGWYASAANELGTWLIYLLLEDVDIPGVFTRQAQWLAVTRAGELTPCHWDYIAQAGPVTRLIKENAA